MNRENFTEKEIVQFLEYYNQPDRFGFYHKIQEGNYPIYNLNLEEHELWMMISDFFSTYRINNVNFNHNTDFFRTGIKRGLLKGLRQLLSNKRLAGENMTVRFLTLVARSGIWLEDTNNRKS